MLSCRTALLPVGTKEEKRNYSGTRSWDLIARKWAKMQYFSFHHRDTEGTEKRRFPAVIGKVPWLQELSRRDAETPRNSFFKPVDTSSNTGVHHRYHRPDSFSVILCVSARNLFHSDRRVSGNTWIVTEKLQITRILTDWFASIRSFLSGWGVFRLLFLGVLRWTFDSDNTLRGCLGTHFRNSLKIGRLDKINPLF